MFCKRFGLKTTIHQKQLFCNFFKFVFVYKCNASFFATDLALVSGIAGKTLGCPQNFYNDAFHSFAAFILQFFWDVYFPLMQKYICSRPYSCLQYACFNFIFNVAISMKLF